MPPFPVGLIVIVSANRPLVPISTAPPPTTALSAACTVAWDFGTATTGLRFWKLVSRS
jgi:hypothetical protein